LKQWAAAIALGSFVTMAAASGDATTVVAPVTEVWKAGPALDRFQVEMANRFKDAPDRESFMAKERWVVVVDWERPSRTITVKARAGDVDELFVGDIVEIAFAEPDDATSYMQLSRVTRIVCRKADSKFLECAKSAHLGSRNEKGERATWSGRNY
jgi:hypothetical protein